MTENNTTKKGIPFWLHVIIIIILAFFALILAANYFNMNFSCVNLPSLFKNDVSAQHCAYAEQALEITDMYLDYELSAETASFLIDELKARENELPNSTGSKDTLIESKVTILSGRLMLAGIESSSQQYNEILSLRNELADLIGKKER
ncbi:MAG: hypothetical protein IJ298_08470 [Ruminococcus sp.]|nr:hypothetical protein [Ruminococcus sp.]